MLKEEFSSVKFRYFAKKVPDVKYKEMGIEEIEKIKKVLEEKKLEVQKTIAYEKMQKSQKDVMKTGDATIKKRFIDEEDLSVQPVKHFRKLSFA